MRSRRPPAPDAILTSVAWFWIVNAATLLLVILPLLATYPLYGDSLPGWLDQLALPGLAPLQWVARHLMALLVVHAAACVLALLASAGTFRGRYWAVLGLELMSWLSLAYTLVFAWVYFHFWFSLLAPAGGGLAISPAVSYALVIAIGIGLVLMIGVPFLIVIHFLRRPAVRASLH